MCGQFSNSKTLIPLPHYIEYMCDEHPYLDERYGIRSNRGYGAAKHIEGIKKNGISEWHRRTFGICKKY